MKYIIDLESFAQLTKQASLSGVAAKLLGAAAAGTTMHALRHTPIGISMDFGTVAKGIKAGLKTGKEESHAANWIKHALPGIGGSDLAVLSHSGRNIGVAAKKHGLNVVDELMTAHNNGAVNLDLIHPAIRDDVKTAFGRVFSTAARNKHSYGKGIKSLVTQLLL
jgi:hypothetical protein